MPDSWLQSDLDAIDYGQAKGVIYVFSATNGNNEGRMYPAAYAGVVAVTNVDYKGVRHPSCFSAPSKATGSVHVHPKQKAQWEARMKTLIDTIRYQLDPDTVLPPKQTDRPMLTTELFYDNVLKTPEDVRVAAALRAGMAMGKRKRECAEA